MNNQFYLAIVCLIGGLMSACSPAAPGTPPPATQTPIPTVTYTPAPTSTPTITPTPVLPFEGKLAYASDQDGDYEIFVITAQTGAPVQLTHNDTEDRHPAISPDGSRIAYASRVDGLFKLFIMDQDGSNTTLAYEHDELNVYDPKWSPDGTKIAACIGNRELETKTCDVFVIDLTSGEATQITSLGFAICPEWSPDGDKLAFSADFEGFPNCLHHQFNRRGHLQPGNKWSVAFVSTLDAHWRQRSAGPSWNIRQGVGLHCISRCRSWNFQQRCAKHNDGNRCRAQGSNPYTLFTFNGSNKLVAGRTRNDY